jgi:hypothetical protein
MAHAPIATATKSIEFSRPRGLPTPRAKAPPCSGVVSALLRGGDVDVEGGDLNDLNASFFDRLR